MRRFPTSWLLAMAFLPALIVGGPRVWPADADADSPRREERPPSAPVISPGHVVVDWLEPNAERNDQLAAHLQRNATGGESSANNASSANNVTARPIGGFVACFDDNVPSAVRSAFERALSVWTGALLLTGPAIELDVYWTSFSAAGALAASGPSRFVQDAALPDPQARYPAALANQIVGLDYSPRDTCDRTADGEGVVYLNSTAGGDGSVWHLPSTSPPSNKIDLESVITHEIAHALGFLSSASVDAAGIQRWPYDFGAPYIYDRFFRRCPAESPCSAPASQPVEASSLSPVTQGDLWFHLPHAGILQLYAPETWDPGSSLSHLDEDRYMADSGFSLLSPHMTRGEEHNGIDNATLSVMQTIGWTIERLPAAPSEVRVTAGDALVQLEFETAPLETAPAAIDYQVTLYREGFQEQTVTVPGSPVILAGLVNGEQYEFSVQARTGSGFSAHSAKTQAVIPLEFPPFATAESFVTRSYQQLLGRDPTPTELATLAANTRASEGNLGSILNQLADDRDVLEQRQIVRLYLGFFNRQPDAGGLDFWIDRGQQGDSLERIALQFARASEFEQGSEVGDEAFVVATYERVLGRAPDAGGLSYWRDELAGGLDRGRLLLLFSESPEHLATSGASSEVTVLYRALLGRAPTTVEHDEWVSVVRNLGRLPLIEALIASDEYQSLVIAAGR